MKWTEMRQKHPNKFILIGDVVEEKISETKFRILVGNILKVSEDGKGIREAYQQLYNISRKKMALLCLILM